MSAEVLKPLEGEDAIPSVAPEKVASNTARTLAIVGCMVAVMAAIGFAVLHFRHRDPPVIADKQTSTKGATTARASSLKMPDPASALGNAPAGSSPGGAAAGASRTAPGTTVPDIALQDGDAQAIPVRSGSAGPGQRTGAGGGARQPKPVDPDDAPIFAGTPGTNGHQARVTMGGEAGAGYGPGYGGGQPDQPNARPADGGSDPTADATARMNALQAQLGGLMKSVQNRMNPTAGAATNVPTSAINVSGAGSQSKATLFDSMEKSATPRVSAHTLGDRSMIVAKGTLFLCSLKTRVVSAISGFVGCQTERNVFSDDGKVLLLERGSHLDGEYRVVTIKPGVTRVPVLWTRIRTSKGVVVDLDSPATGELGESGLDGYVDNRWGERLGAAILLSLIEDAIQYATTPANGTGSTSVVLPNTSTQGSKLAEKVLDTTINIPPLLYQNQGGVVGVYVARDVDFSSVYELRPK